MRKRLTLLGIALVLASGYGTLRYAYAEDNKEYLVKAAFIYNFVKFVEWPADKAIGKQSNIDICVVGNSGMSGAAAVFKEGSTAALKLSLVEEKSWRAAPEHCHIVFISKSEESRLSDMLSVYKEKPLLTVSDIPNFAESGGMIGFVTSDNKIKIAVNNKSVAAAGMRVDAQLLEIALKVIDK